MKIKHYPNREGRPSTWRLYHRGKRTWHRSEEAAKKAADKLDVTKGKRMTNADKDEYWHAREILKGVPILRAARYYVEMHRTQNENSAEKTSALIDRFKLTLRGRPKYLIEAKRNLDLLSEECGDLLIGAVTSEAIADFLDRFGSPWSHDAALKFARSFFKWVCGPKVKARRDNPAEAFDFKKPTGSKIYLTLPDVEHVVKICREEFPQILPAIGLQLFAGIRTEEIIRCQWSMIRRGMIRLPAEVAKMGQVKGKSVPRHIDFWPKALDGCMPDQLPTTGPIVPAERKHKGKVSREYLHMKGELIARCKETKPDFRWGQNAFRHSYGTYGYAFFQSGDKMTKLMGERDVDTLVNFYAEYETEENGQKFMSIGSPVLEPLPIPKNALALIQRIAQAVEPQKKTA